jgi:hypothetical protein
VEVSERAAAGMFLPNLVTWRERPFISANYRATELDDLSDALQSMVDAGSDRMSIVFGLRRIVLTHKE